LEPGIGNWIDELPPTPFLFDAASKQKKQQRRNNRRDGEDSPVSPKKKAVFFQSN
jgi:hypothetical protein